MPERLADRRLINLAAEDATASSASEDGSGTGCTGALTASKLAGGAWTVGDAGSALVGGVNKGGERGSLYPMVIIADPRAAGFVSSPGSAGP